MWSWFKIYFSVVTKAFYEVAFVLLPVAVWMVVIFSVGGTKEEIKSLVAWPFAGLALFGASLRDGISAFHQDTPFDKRQRDYHCGLADWCRVVYSLDDPWRTKGEG